MHTPVDMIFCFQNANNISVHYYVHTKYINSDLRTISQDVFCSKRRETSCELTVLFEANRVPEHFASSQVFPVVFVMFRDLFAYRQSVYLSAVTGYQVRHQKFRHSTERGEIVKLHHRT